MLADARLSRAVQRMECSWALERRDSVCQPHWLRGADSAALTEGAAEPSTIKRRKPADGAGRERQPELKRWLEAWQRQPSDNSPEPGKRFFAPPASACPRHARRPFGMTEEHPNYAHRRASP
jgi:hypothetical protein